MSTCSTCITGHRGSLKKSLIVLFALAALAAGVAIARGEPNASTSKSKQSSLALGGYCPVCVIEMKKWVRGNPEHQVTYDGKTYRFPGEKQKQTFLANPNKYVPALGGDCTVCYAKTGKRVPGNIRHAVFHDKRLFLFPGANEKKEFLANPKKYANVDLALNGDCAVCKADANKDVPGKPEFTAIHQGLRYQFPSDKQRNMFLANPAKYAVKPLVPKQLANAAAKLITVQGKSGCAGCDHGVHPIGAGKTLGLAVNAPDGKVYVVEDAHELYPNVYEKRFDELSLQVSGKVLKHDGKFTWIQPSELKVL